MTTVATTRSPHRSAAPGTHGPVLVRSPLHLFTFVIGIVVTAAGWALATLFGQTTAVFTIDLSRLLVDLPPWSGSAPRAAATIGAVGVAVVVHVGLLRRRQFRELSLGYVAMAIAVGLSVGAGTLLRAVLDPSLQALFDVPAGAGVRDLPTDPAVAAILALLVLTRRSLSARNRHDVSVLVPLWLIANLAVDPAVPYLGWAVDLGLGMVAGSITALAARTPSQRSGREAIVSALAASGISVVELEPADVDARGSVPWFATTSEGQRLFVKALSSEQRVADLMFRALRWVRLRRTGDAPPETSLRRAAEHEAFISHHVRCLGVPTPALVAEADLGDGNVALAYRAVVGCSLDKAPPEELTDAVLCRIWAEVAVLRAHGVAHRDLRLANVFLDEAGGVLLIDFGFGELAASRQLLDTDVAELLAATASVVGPDRAVRVALDVLGSDALDGAREWLHPLALSTATRRAVGHAGFSALRDELEQSAGLEAVELEPLGRLSSQRLLTAALLAIGAYSLAAVVDDGWSGSDLQPHLILAAAVVSLLTYPVAALAYRSATAGRAPFAPTLRAVAESRLPLAAATSWSWAARVLSKSTRGAGLTATTTRRATGRWLGVGMVTAPVLVAGFSAATLRVTHGYVAGIVGGVLIGAVVAVAQLTLLHVSPWGRDLVRVWLDPAPTIREGRDTLTATLGLWTAVHILHGAAFVLAARAVGVSAATEALIAIAIGTYAIAALTPSPGGFGAIEVGLYLGLAVGADVESAALAVIVARVATFWLHMPIAMVAHRRAVRDNRTGGAP